MRPTRCWYARSATRPRPFRGPPRRISRSLETNERRLVDVLEVRRVDEPQLPHEPVEKKRVCARAACEEMHALQDLAVSDPGRDESEVIAAGQILSSVDASLVLDPHLLRTAALLIAPEAEPSEYF